MTGRSPSGRSAPSRSLPWRRVPARVLWDIGCGSGSVAIEWMLRHPDNLAYGIERDAVRAARIAAQCGGAGRAGAACGGGARAGSLRRPAGARCGVSGRGCASAGVIDTAWQALRPGGRMVANAVVIETEAALFAAREKFGGTLTRLSVERLDAIGSLHGFRPGADGDAMGGDQAMIVAGIGFSSRRLGGGDRGAGAARGRSGRAPGRTFGRAGFQGAMRRVLHEAAQTLGLPLRLVIVPCWRRYRRVAPRIPGGGSKNWDWPASRKPAPWSRPGENSHLLVARLAQGNVTCAIAGDLP